MHYKKEELIPFTIAKKDKYLWITLTEKMKDPYTENYDVGERNWRQILGWSYRRLFFTYDGDGASPA